jgi:hypothetical protein
MCGLTPRFRLFASTRRWRRVNESEYYLPPDDNQPSEPNVTIDLPVDTDKPKNDMHRSTKVKNSGHSNGRVHTTERLDLKV